MIATPRTTRYSCLVLQAWLVLFVSQMFFGPASAAQGAPSPTFEQLSAQATSAREAGQTGDAIRLYRRAVDLQPDWAEGWWYLGTLNYDTDHFSDAIPPLQALLKLSPQMGPALAFLGLSEFEIKDYKNSLLHLQQAHQLGYADDTELEKVAIYHLAQLYNWSGEFEKTADVLAPSIKQHRPPDEIKVVLGMALLRIPLLASELDPSKDALIHAAGDAAVMLNTGNSAAAAAALRQLLSDYPNTPYLHAALAEALARGGKNEDALQQLAAETKATPASTESSQRQLYLRTKVGESLAQTTPAPAAQSGDFEALAEKAKDALAAGQVPAAIAYCQRALAIHPDWEEGWRNLGTLEYGASQYSDAVVALKNAAAINPQNGNVWALLGLSEFETRDYKNSLIHLERGRDLGFAGNPAAMQIAKYHLAILLNQSGDFDKATELLTSATVSGPLGDQVQLALGMALLRIPRFPEQLDPHDVALVRLAGETAALLSESKYDQAFSGFQQLLKMNASTPYLHYAYGSALASASRYDEAESQLLEETKITPSSPLPYLRRSTIALQLHHADIAFQLAQQAVHLAPDSAEAHYLLGRSMLELGKTADSVKELEVARGLAPNSPEVRFNLARAYAKAGNPDAAEQERAAFERLNALVQRKKSQTGSQAYGAIQNQNGIRAAEPSAPTEAH